MREVNLRAELLILRECLEFRTVIRRHGFEYLAESNLAIQFKNEIMNQLAEKSSMNEEYILNQIAHTQILLQERLDNQQEIINRLEYLTFKKIENSTVSGCSQKKGGWNILVDGYDQKIQREIEKWERVKMQRKRRKS